MRAKSKFYGIHFPFFGLKAKPYSFSFTSNSILVQPKEFGPKLLLDVYSDSKSLTARYIHNKDDSFNFDYTCLNMNHLILAKLKWGIDSKARVYNLSQKQTFLARNVKIVRVKGNLLWVSTVSYPFTIKSSLVDTKLLLEQYVTIINIDQNWYLYKFTSFHEKITKVEL